MRAWCIPMLLVAAIASAQDTKAPPTKAPPTKTPPAAKQETKVQTKQDTKATAPATTQDAKAAPATKQDTKAAAAGQPRAALNVAPEAPPPRPVQILREAFDYTSAGRRDPFNSLMGSAELRPTVADLRLAGVLYHPTRPVAVMTDITTNTQYRVTLGATLGRMRVILIKPKVVIFSIEEFGVNRQDSLVLGDTTKVRAR